VDGVAASSAIELGWPDSGRILAGQWLSMLPRIAYRRATFPQVKTGISR
jgi:hypothetical protein